MAKKQIKLSEAQLRDMIAENVNKVLSELDWKTYQNAADKAYRMGNKVRAEKFTKAAMNKFKDDYGDENTMVYPDTQGNQPDFHYIQTLRDKNGNIKDVNFQDIRWNDNGKYGGWGAHGWPNPTSNPFYSVPKNTIKADNRFKGDSDTFDKMDDEFNKHIGNRNVGNRHSQYAYDREKGWHLKENKIAKIVAESVKKFLKEYEDFNQEETIGDELQQIKDAVTTIRQKMGTGGLAGLGYDPTVDSFFEGKINEIEEAVDALLNNDWY